MKLERWWYLVLYCDCDGTVSVCDGAEQLGQIEAPDDLKIEDGSFLKFGQELAKGYGWKIEPELGMEHCLRLV